MPLTELDRCRLDQALLLAEQAVGLSDPNPRVGCIVGLVDGVILGQGHTQRAGEAHAEVMALREAAQLGHDVRGATAWVTLEPCAHRGRTPPCCDALIAAGIARVVVLTSDPFPKVAGEGLRRLAAAGIDVVLDEPSSASAKAARDLNIGFFSRHERGRPWVRLKLAASLDGRSSLPDGTSQWITGPAARADGHAWRRRASAVLTGIGTVAADDPRLDVRLVETQLQPLRVVLDSRLQMSPRARVLSPPGQVLVVCAIAPADAPRAAQLQASGAEILHLPGVDGRVDLLRLLQVLALRSVNEIHVEAGPSLSGAWLRQGLVDEMIVFLAPFLMGPGRAMVDLSPLAVLPVQTDFKFIDTAAVGPDLRLRLRRSDGPVRPA